MPSAALTRQLTIDFPLEGERIASQPYTVRLSAVGDENGARVVLAVDDEAPRPCRQAAGHWWYDWESPAPGEHRLTAALLSSDGEVLAGAVRTFAVARVRRERRAGAAA